MLEDCMQKSNLVCMNDSQQTYRNSSSVIDLFIVTPSLVKTSVIAKHLHMNMLGLIILVYYLAFTLTWMKKRHILQKSLT